MLSAYERLLERLRRPLVLNTVKELLFWDQEVVMPPGGAPYREEEMGVLGSLQQELVRDPCIGELLEEVDTESLSDEQQAMVREARRLYERAANVPEELAENLQTAKSAAEDAWREAREQDDYSLFAPRLKRLVELKRAEAEAIDPDRDPYRVLHEGFAPYVPLEHTEEMLEEVRTVTTALFERIEGCPVPEREFLDADADVEERQRLHRLLTEEVGFDFENGRLDEIAHPYTFHLGECRVTTRYTDAYVAGFIVTAHELGHALSSQAIPRRLFGTPLCFNPSTTYHEAQSKLYENHLARGRPFWKHYYPLFQEAFSALEDVSFEDFYAAVNVVEAGEVRVTADELTYPLHIIVRFELEKRLIRGELSVVDLPAAFNERMYSLLGVSPSSDARGVLQDPHWANGFFGYFPTYVTGSVLAAQLYEAAQQEIAGLEEGFADGDFLPLRDWLSENVWRHGARYTADEVAQRVTGKPLSADAYASYLEEKYSSLYNF